ncbi:MAG: protein kinase [Rubripirellula sp.]
MPVPLSFNVESIAEVKLQFLRCIEIPRGERRDRWLGQLSCRSPEIAEEVRGLLESESKPGLIDQVFDLEPTDADDEPTVAIGSGLGNEERQIAGIPETISIQGFHLIDQVGEGGMGAVFRAEQFEPLCRTVAIKVVRPGLNSEQILGRFDRERQTLAIMDHPAIATVFDAGTTDQGQPYFAMEFVEGHAITCFCNDSNYGIPERLRLFVEVCDGVQHAHQKGIIHRDLKPNNVLVAATDGRPAVKIIDFGIAKVAKKQTADETQHTLDSAVIGTPIYMSPEQADASYRDIDTRSDVYSLGIILYELLVGVTPLDRDLVRNMSAAELQKQICEVHPLRPSMRRDSLFSGRQSRDLDWIVMRAIEKDRNRRYPSAGALAEDVQRYLVGDAVVACPPSMRYRFRIYSSKNRGLLASLGAVLFAMLIGTGVSIWFAISANEARGDADALRLVAEAQRQEAEAARQVALEAKAATKRSLQQSREDFSLAMKSLDRIVREVASPQFAELEGANSIQETIFSEAFAFYENFTQNHDKDPYARMQQAKSHSDVAFLYERTGHPKKQRVAIDQAISILAGLTKEFPGNPEYADRLTLPLFQRSHATWRTAEERLSDAEWALRLAKHANWIRPTDNSDWLALLHVKVAENLDQTSPRCVELIRQSIEIASNADRPVPPDAYRHLAMANSDKGNVDEADRYYRKAAAGFDQLAGMVDPQEAYIQSWLAVTMKEANAKLLESSGRFGNAESLYKEACDRIRKVYTIYRHDLMVRRVLQHTHTSLAEFLDRRDRRADADLLLADLVAQFPDSADAHLAKAKGHSRRSEPEKAIQEYAKAVDLASNDPMMNLHYARSILNEAPKHLRDLDRAISHAKLVVSMKPYDLESLNVLTSLALESPGGFELAKQTNLRALRIQPASPRNSWADKLQEEIENREEFGNGRDANSSAPDRSQSN